MKRIAVYPGSFDPVTLGHLDIIKRAMEIFDEVIVAVAHNTRKTSFFAPQERVKMLQEATKYLQGITIESFSGLIVEFARQRSVKFLIRGVRMFSDFEYELQMALTNRRLAHDIETVFLMPSEGYSFLSSTLIKEAAFLGADISSFVPDFVAKRFQEKILQKV